ncbi:trypsin-like serine protease [Lysobacter sp. CA199]|uniref:trypsin-like serine protease n=1 Tax=Lysobacter sp. CA199 TaxID=3455608 RepID=UPI003F8D2514
MKHYFLLGLIATSFTAGAVVSRDDIEDSRYQIPASSLPALVDFPCEGHGVLIAPQWVLTVAHVASPHAVAEVTVGGLPRKVKDTVVHPGYRALPDALAKEALATGDSSKVMAFLALSDDIALVELEEPVADTKPVPLFRGADEVGKTVQLIGKGGTGKGGEGEIPHGPHRTTLRRAFNVISSADTRWISYTFDPPETAVRLEGMMGSGDSGGPVLIRKNRQWQLAGLASWKSVQGDVPGRYGDGGNNVRISRYIAWIESVVFSNDPAQPPTGG